MSRAFSALNGLWPINPRRVPWAHMSNAFGVQGGQIAAVSVVATYWKHYIAPITLNHTPHPLIRARLTGLKTWAIHTSKPLIAQHPMKTSRFSRRHFLQNSVTAAGALVLGGGSLLDARSATVPKRTAVDQVTLGQTGIKLSRLGMGTGSNSGQAQFDLGREGFNSLVKYAYDQGITFFDCSQSYKTFEWL